MKKFVEDNLELVRTCLDKYKVTDFHQILVVRDFIEKIFDKVLMQTEHGKVEFGSDDLSMWTYYVELENEQSSKENSGKISLKIRNKKELIENLKQYLEIAKKFYSKDKYYFDLDDNSFYEKLVLDLFVNTNNFDLNNFESFVKQRTEMLKEDCSLKERLILGQYLGSDIIVEITKNTSNLEGPFKFRVAFDDGINTFNLPSVTFGKIKDEVFVYCLQGEKEKQTNSLAKKMDRHFRKANKDVDMEDEILSQVSVSALISLTIFLAYQKSNGVKNVSAYNFMPVRYETVLTTKTLKLKEQQSLEEFQIEHDRNQFNITNKFFNTLIRYAHHFNLNYDYDDISEKLEFSLKNAINNGENIIFDIEKSVLSDLENSIN